MYNKGYNRKQKQSVCKCCGKPINWVRPKGPEQKAIPVEPQKVYFLPGDGKETFIMTNGKEGQGRSASDGIIGYKRHSCNGFKAMGVRKNWSEEELAKRRWA